MKSPLLIVWKEINNLGIPIIDEQHRAIVSIINTFNYFLKNGGCKEMFISIINMLDEYTKLHFTTEENLMKEADYEKYEEHMIHHLDIKSRMDRISRDAFQYEDTAELIKILKDWWLNHINVDDRKYVPSVQRIL